MEQTLNYSMRLIEDTINSLKTFFKNMAESWVVARQCQANYHVAEILKRTGEYPYMSVHEIHMMLNRKTLGLKND